MPHQSSFSRKIDSYRCSNDISIIFLKFPNHFISSGRVSVKSSRKFSQKVEILVAFGLVRKVGDQNDDEIGDGEY